MLFYIIGIWLKFTLTSQLCLKQMHCNITTISAIIIDQYGKCCGINDAIAPGKQLVSHEISPCFCEYFSEMFYCFLFSAAFFFFSDSSFCHEDPSFCGMKWKGEKDEWWWDGGVG